MKIGLSRLCGEVIADACVRYCGKQVFRWRLQTVTAAERSQASNQHVGRCGSATARQLSRQ